MGQARAPIDQRFVGEIPWSPTRSKEPRQQIWIKADGELPDDPLLHACVITYASDMSLLDSVLGHIRSAGTTAPSCREFGSLHVFHREVHADHWLLYDMDSPIAHGGRGLARGFLFNESGQLMTSMVQEDSLEQSTHQ